MANRPKRNKTSVSQPNQHTNTTESIGDSVENLDKENKTYRNKSKKRKPFIQYISLRKYKAPNLDKYFKVNRNGY